MKEEADFQVKYDNKNLNMIGSDLGDGKKTRKNLVLEDSEDDDQDTFMFFKVTKAREMLSL